MSSIYRHESGSCYLLPQLFGTTAYCESRFLRVKPLLVVDESWLMTRLIEDDISQCLWLVCLLFVGEKRTGHGKVTFSTSPH